MKRKTLSEFLRKGMLLTQGGVTRSYYSAGPLGDAPFMEVDPILTIFVGKFGTDILKSIDAEHRFEIYTEARVWDRPQVCERLTKAINGGIWELHQRLGMYPKLHSVLCERGFHGIRKYTSVFGAITFLNDRAKFAPLEIAAALEESKL